MKSPLRILYLEDNKRDVDLVTAYLDAEGVDHLLVDVDSRKAFAEELSETPPDVVFSDYTLPSYNGLHALEDAMRIAVERNKRNWRYTAAILKRWQEEGRDERKNRQDTEKDRRRYIEGEYSDFIEH